MITKGNNYLIVELLITFVLNVWPIKHVHAGAHRLKVHKKSSKKHSFNNFIIGNTRVIVELNTKIDRSKDIRSSSFTH